MRNNDKGELMIVSLPSTLQPHRRAINAGLYYLALSQPESDACAGGACKSTRLRISGKARHYLDALTSKYGSKRQTIIQALTWVAAQEPARRALLENTII